MTSNTVPYTPSLSNADLQTHLWKLCKAQKLWTGDCNKTVANKVAYFSLWNDRIAGRIRQEDTCQFITDKWFNLQVIRQDNCCCYCDGVMEHNKNRKTNPRAVTVERKNNDLAHTRTNCVLACRDCNMRRNKQLSHDDMIIHAHSLKNHSTSHCGRCGEVKDAQCFHRVSEHTKTSKGHVYNSYCKDCLNARSRERRQRKKKQKTTA